MLLHLLVSATVALGSFALSVAFVLDASGVVNTAAAPAAVVVGVVVVVVVVLLPSLPADA